MQTSSVMTFTYELSVNGKIPFQDVNIKSPEEQFVTNVYRKTDGKLLNEKSECHDRYKSSVIIDGIRRERIRSAHLNTYLIMNSRDENKYWFITAIPTLTLIMNWTSFHIEQTQNKLPNTAIKSRFIIKI